MRAINLGGFIKHSGQMDRSGGHGLEDCTRSVVPIGEVEENKNREEVPIFDSWDLIST